MGTLNDLTASAVIEGLDRGDFSAEEVRRDNLARVEARNDAVRAWVHLDPEQALEAARASDVQRKRGDPCGALGGVPIGVKDIIDTADMPTEHGSPIYAGHQSAQDAGCVAALKAAGAVVMGNLGARAWSCL